jgi:hypothetical protein
MMRLPAEVKWFYGIIFLVFAIHLLLTTGRMFWHAKLEHRAQRRREMPPLPGPQYWSGKQKKDVVEFFFAEVEEREIPVRETGWALITWPRKTKASQVSSSLTPFINFSLPLRAPGFLSRLPA